tara:strand:+ start:67 stop:186 length:120 start_codon:yes stop_codon:yes gene_type:complete
MLLPLKLPLAEEINGFSASIPTLLSIRHEGEEWAVWNLT